MNTTTLHAETAETKMEFYDTVTDDATKALIAQIIAHYGFTVEHNYDYFMSLSSQKRKPVLIYFGDHKGMLAVHHIDGRWDVVSEVMAPEIERPELFVRFAKHILDDCTNKKLYLEFTPKSKRAVSTYLKQNNLSESIILGKNVYTFFCPLCNLAKWDPELRSKEFDNLKDTKRKFDKRFTVEVLEDKDVLSLPISEFTRLTHDWRKNRKAHDQAEYKKYLTFFENKFRGGERNLAVKIDGKLRAVASGWSVPNTSGNVFYYSISLHDYSISGIGDLLGILFFNKLKRDGYTYLDFGGSGKALLNYKKKFQPESIYTVYCFFVRRGNVCRNASSEQQ